MSSLRPAITDRASLTWHGLPSAPRLQGLSENENELKSIGLIRLAVVERHTGLLYDAVDLLNEAAPFVETSGAWTRGFFHLEFAVALKDLGISESRSSYFDKAQTHYLRFSFWRISVRG